MDILTKPISSFSFEDVAEFCKKGFPEGIEIDYKKEYPQKGIEKFFAAFSNTRGGAILIGVEEDRKTGRPIVWEGVDDDAKIVERMYQESCNVSPQPSFEVHKTNPGSKGKVFILIRIFEGSKTPYYVQNDSNIWVRTGNISNPIDISSPEWTELLVGKKEKADRARGAQLKMAENVYVDALAKAEKERQTLISQAKQKGDGSENNYYQKPLGNEVTMFCITLQPYFPRETLGQPRDILQKIEKFSYPRNASRDFPDLNQAAIPEGLMHFQHNYNGFIECQQLYSKGLVYDKLDVLRVNEHGKRIVYLSYIAGRLFVVLKATQSFYQSFGYQGAVRMSLTLTGLKDVFLSEIRPDGFLFWDDEKEGLMHNYDWSFDFDTRDLNDSDRFKSFFYEVMREIYWYLGFKELPQNILEKFLEQNRLS